MPNQPMSDDNPLKGKKSGKWTKYGGAISGLVKERIVDKWYCQTCGKEMPAELKPFLYERCEGDFLRVCPSCTNVLYKENIEVETLIRIVRIERY